MTQPHRAIAAASADQVAGPTVPLLRAIAARVRDVLHAISPRTARPELIGLSDHVCRDIGRMSEATPTNPFWQAGGSVW